MVDDYIDDDDDDDDRQKRRDVRHYGTRGGEQLVGLVVDGG